MDHKGEDCKPTNTGTRTSGVVHKQDPTGQQQRKVSPETVTDPSDESQKRQSLPTSEMLTSHKKRKGASNPIGKALSNACGILDGKAVNNTIVAGGNPPAGLGLDESPVDPLRTNHPNVVPIEAGEDLDFILALSLQQELDQQQAKQEQETELGKAWDFCHKVTANHRKLLEYDPNNPNMNAHNFSLIAEDEIVFLAQRVFETQKHFAQQGKDVHVDIGYHYTKSANMDRIRTDGLLTKTERENANIQPSSNNGATFGDGIYTGNNPYSYHGFAGGDQGLFVARLKGRVGDHNTDDSSPDNIVDTVLGRRGATDEVCVLKQSKQCVALVKFNAPLVALENDRNVGNSMVYAYHCKLQAIVDECFNEKRPTMVPKLLPSQVCLRRCGTMTAPSGSLSVISYKAPETLRETNLLEDATEPVQSSSLPVGVDECSVCLGIMKQQQQSQRDNDVVSLKKCSHYFHKSCLEECVQRTRKCPMCRSPIGEPQGTMPSGCMQIELRSDLRCPGFELTSTGTIVICYDFDAGVQKCYHENPGHTHGSTTRIAYLPDCPDGRNVLKRLKYAFLHGLTFDVGTSATTGLPDAIIWASIHHKTSLGPGALHGYPDVSYFYNVNEELDALHVPRAEDLH